MEIIFFRGMRGSFLFIDLPSLNLFSSKKMKKEEMNR